MLIDLFFQVSRVMSKRLIKELGKHALNAWNNLGIRKSKVPTDCRIAHECFLVLKH